MGNGDGPRYSFHQSFVCLLDVTQVGDVEQDVLHEAGWARVCVSGRQHHILLSVHPWVDRLQLVQNAKLQKKYILDCPDQNLLYLDKLSHHGRVAGDKNHPGFSVDILNYEGSSKVACVDSCVLVKRLQNLWWS